MIMSTRARREVEMLTWQYIDEVIDVDEFRKLERFLIDYEEARQTYVDCTVLHALLLEYYRKEREARQNVRVANDPFLSQLLDDDVIAPIEEVPEFDDEELNDASRFGQDNN